MKITEVHWRRMLLGLSLWPLLAGCAALPTQETAPEKTAHAAALAPDHCTAEAEAFRDGDYAKLSRRFTPEFAERLNAERFDALRKELAKQGEITEVRFLDTLNRNVYSTALWKIVLQKPATGERMERVLQIMTGAVDGAPRVIALSVQ